MGSHSYFHINREQFGSHEDYRQHSYAFFRDYVPWIMLREDVPEKPTG